MKRWEILAYAVKMVEDEIEKEAPEHVLRALHEEGYRRINPQFDVQ